MVDKPTASRRGLTSKTKLRKAPRSWSALAYVDGKPPLVHKFQWRPGTHETELLETCPELKRLFRRRQ